MSHSEMAFFLERNSEHRDARSTSEMGEGARGKNKGGWAEGEVLFMVVVFTTPADGPYAR